MASPAIAPPDVRDVTLSVFAGRKTDIAPSDLPEGLSPDTEDGIYLPGMWQTRPALSRLFAPGVSIPAGAQILYHKTYMQPNGDAVTLILDSFGDLWVEDTQNFPLALGFLDFVPPGSSAQSITEFGREYIAVSDLLHGQGVPLQYDGTFLDRVTMDGPGAAPIAADEDLSFNIAASPAGILNPGALNITSISEVGNVVTVNFVTGSDSRQIAAELVAASQNALQVKIAGVGTAGYNGTFVVATISEPGTAQASSITYVNPNAGLGALGAGGTLQFSVVAVKAPGAAGVYRGGDFGSAQMTIAGAGVAGYNGTWLLCAYTFLAGNDTFYLNIPIFAANSGNGTVTTAGRIDIGTHGLVQMFLTRQGYLTKPSPISYWTAAGGKRAIVTNLAIGPANVVARVIGLTGVGGGNFFTQVNDAILRNPSGPVTFIRALVVPDNTSSQWTIDISDNALFAGIPIDVIGNDLFDQVVLGPVLGFFAFASRLACWGDYTKIENFRNEGFEGGFLSAAPNAPLVWSILTAGGALINGGSWHNGQAWQITTDNTGNPNGQLSQPAYQDSFGDAILSPLTAYIFRAWVAINTPAAGVAHVVAELFSASAGSLATATLDVSGLVNGKFLQANFSVKTPAVIPADTVLRLSANTSGFSFGSTPLVTIDDWMIVFAQNPYRNQLSRWSYAVNPEAFAQTTGNLGPSDDVSPLQCFALLRQSALLETSEGIHIFQDNDFEPDQWNVNQLTRAVGALSLRSGDPGKFGTGDASEDWALIASKNGVYLFAGSAFYKVSQEISRGSLPQAQDPRKCWDDINWAAQQTIVAKNDPSTRRAYFAVPLNGATQPNTLFVLDYREMDTAAQIANAPPLHITLQGKMKSSDLTRKWSVWNIPANDLEILVRPGNQRQLYVAGGANAQGQTFGGLYSLDPSKLTDDDYGKIGGPGGPFYTTYFFTDHETEQALNIGSDLHLVKHIHAFIAGVGMATITPIVNSLYNFQPQLSPRLLVKDTDAGTFLDSDLEWTNVGLRGQRIAFRISVQPLPGATDVQLRLQKFVVGMMRDPVAPFRQSGV